jgi:hypothetical protein
MRFLYCLLVYLHAAGLCSQTDNAHSVIFHPMYGGSSLQMDHYYKSGTDSVLIETLKFYISGIELMHNSKVVWKESNSFHLVDISEVKTLSFKLKIPSSLTYDQLKLNLGIDSVTNVAGAMGGDLDPTKGMYWSWQSGYINFKLEGRSNVCKTRNNEFQLHLGGYQHPYNSLASTWLPVSTTSQTDIFIDVEQMLKCTDLVAQHHIMSPGKEAVLLSEKVLKMLYTRKFEK